MSFSFILVAGGTGGHVFPALSLAQKIIEKGHEVKFYTDPRGHSYIKNLQDFYKDKIVFEVLPLARPNVRLKFYFSLLFCFFKLFAQSFKKRPDMVIGFGGYPALAWGIVAGIRNIPLVIHEQNAVLGRTNKILSYWAKGVASAFPLSFSRHCSTRVVGLPIRPEFKEQPYILPDVGQKFCLLILGGSQGASIFSRVIPQALQSLPTEMQEKIKVIQQCRLEDIQEVQSFYDTTQIEVTLAPFFSNVADLLTKSHFIIARSGASTLAEIMTVNRPVLLVPYPSLQNEQAANAKIVTQAGRGWCISQQDFSVQRLKIFLERLLKAPQLLIFCSNQLKKKDKNTQTFFAPHDQAPDQFFQFILELRENEKMKEKSLT